MYIKRKLYAKLLDWKQTDQGSTAILIEGARRSGKSFLATDFASKEYRSFLYIDFSKPDPLVQRLFTDYSGNLNDFFARLSLLKHTPLFPRESCIIFDEVQLFPLARQLIKHLVQDGRFDYIETGSLISIKTNVENILIPSEEVRLQLHPLDFEEFLTAINRADIWEIIKNAFEKGKPLSDPIHREIMKFFRIYLVVGGMPQAVTPYADDNNLVKVRKVHRRILDLYQTDIAKFAREHQLKVRSIFDDIPAQLSSHDKKFLLSALRKNARMREYEDAFCWLSDSKIVELCFNATDPTVGLKMNRDRTRLKCYMADTGLLVALTLAQGTDDDDAVINALLYDKLSINAGMFFENIVAQQLRAAGHDLYFHTEYNEVTKRSLEIDFLIRQKKKICPIEVKSGDYKKHASLDQFVVKYGDHLGRRYIITTKDLKRDGETWIIPVYMTGLL